MVTLKCALLSAGFYIICLSFYAHFVLPLFPDAPVRTRLQKFKTTLILLPFVPTGLLPAIAMWLWLRSRPRDPSEGSQSDFEMANFCMALGVFLWPAAVLLPFLP
jgi:hypothetical protein